MMGTLRTTGDIICLITLALFCLAVWIRHDFETAEFTWMMNS